jgi:hypothetical protein
MSEEAENKGGFFSNLKNQIITGAGVALTTLGGIFIDEVKGVLGIADEEEGGAKTEMVQQQQQSQQNNQQVIINIPEQKPAETKTVIKETVKEVPAKPVEKPKEKEQELDW